MSWAGQAGGTSPGQAPQGNTSGSSGNPKSVTTVHDSSITSVGAVFALLSHHCFLPHVSPLARVLEYIVEMSMLWLSGYGNTGQALEERHRILLSNPVSADKTCA